jgi:hypothetical protein
MAAVKDEVASLLTQNINTFGTFVVFHSLIDINYVSRMATKH